MIEAYKLLNNTGAIASELIVEKSKQSSHGHSGKLQVKTFKKDFFLKHSCNAVSRMHYLRILSLNIFESRPEDFMGEIKYTCSFPGKYLGIYARGIFIS